MAQQSPIQSAVAANNPSPLADKDNVEGVKIPRPDYSDDEIIYIGGLQKRLERARRLRDVRHDEFDGMTFIQHWDLEEKLANTWIPPKLNKEDTTFVSGTVRQKIMALLSNFTNIDLGPNVMAFDEDNREVQSLGHAVEDVMEKTEELENDEEKKVMRQYELLKHGYVFVQEFWEEKWIWAKPIVDKFSGMIKSAKWQKRLKMIYAKPIREILAGPNVYLGDITQYDFSKQPYAFTVRYHSWDDAKTVYGDWERWKSVTKAVTPFAPEAGTGTSSIVYNTWRLTEVRENYVEEVHYEDPYNNEKQIILNGVLMMPVGYPLEFEGQMSFTQQNLEPIHPFFAYGGSLVKRLRTQVGILDEMLKLAVLKTQKSFMPARLNLSGKILSPRIFMPGKITAGIDPKEIPTIDLKETEGVTVSELNMIAELQKNIDANSTPSTFQGQPSPGAQNPTATQVLELQRQAKLTLGITIFAVSLLEWKLGWLRLTNVLKNWFNPIDDELDEARNLLKSVYRTVNVSEPISGKGMGRHMIIPTDENITPDNVKEAEDKFSESSGVPVKITTINPDALKQAKYIWQITVTPREKKTTELQKVMFRAFMADAQLFGQSLNMDYLGEKFAEAWNEDPSKLFTKGQMPLPGQQPGGGAGAGAGAPNNPVKPGGAVPGIPNPEQNQNSNFANALKQGQ